MPVKNDPIDKKLAELINAGSQEHLKILFVRYSEGIYYFGTKKITLKQENNGLKVRVGGGYLSILEFLDQFTNIELEKMDKGADSNVSQRRFSYGGRSVTGLGVIPESPAISARRSYSKGKGMSTSTSQEQRDQLMNNLGTYEEVDQAKYQN